ncbi:29014_t:CDS:1, partial [Racocetra persica]
LDEIMILLEFTTLSESTIFLESTTILKVLIEVVKLLSEFIDQ